MIGLALLLLLPATPMAAQVAGPPVIADDPRLQSIPYDAGRVVRLRVPLGYQTTLILDPNERVENLALGDSGSWQVTPNRRGDHVFIKPLQAGGPTNLTVVTDARIYTFELGAANGVSAGTPFTVRFTYPDDPPAATGDATSPPAGSWPYRLSGNRSLQPASVSDDGVRTYIEWRPDQALPAVFAIDDRHREILVDGHMRDGRYVIDAVHQTLLFRLDREVARASRLPPGRSR